MNIYDYSAYAHGSGGTEMHAPLKTLLLSIFVWIGLSTQAFAREEWVKMTHETQTRIENLLKVASGLVVEVPIDSDGVEIVDLSRFGIVLKRLNARGDVTESLVQLRRFGGKSWGLYGMPRPPIQGYVNFSGFQPRFEGSSKRYIFELPVFTPGPGYHRYFYPLTPNAG